jgi:hypothetical protein
LLTINRISRGIYFLNNIYCCYLPAYCSYSLQLLDNSVFNTLKTVYRKELQKLASLTDSTPVDKVNFIYTHKIRITSKNILSSWRVTRNWPILYTKALQHPEIQADKVEISPDPILYLGSDDIPKTSCQIRDLGKHKTSNARRRYTVIAKGFEAQEQVLAEHTTRIASLEEEVDRLKRRKKRKAIPNPNRKFITLSKALASGETIPEVGGQEVSVEVESSLSEEEVSEVESEVETASVIEVPTTTRSGRLVKKPRYY